MCFRVVTIGRILQSLSGKYLVKRAGIPGQAEHVRATPHRRRFDQHNFREAIPSDAQEGPSQPHFHSLWPLPTGNARRFPAGTNHLTFGYGWNYQFRGLRTRWLNAQVRNQISPTRMMAAAS